MQTHAGPSVLAEPIDWRHKAFAVSDSVTPGSLNVLRGDLLFPVVTLRLSALEHNIALMAEFCRRHGVFLAPHAKTHMAPGIFQRELAAGAWGLTAQVPSQARMYRAFGVQKILLANQVVQPSALRWMAGEMQRDPSCEIFCLVDSPEGIRLMEQALDRPVPVLLELDYHGGRAGCRSDGQALATAEAAMASPAVELAGIEGFDALLQDAASDDPVAAVDALIERAKVLAHELDSRGAFASRDEVIVSFGSSTFCDRPAITSWDLARPVRVVLRCGSYSTHDAMYDELSPFAGRDRGEGLLRPALELWTQVLSRPEPDLAIVGVGKRDVSFDVNLPDPLRVRSLDGMERAADGLKLLKLNDHHGYVHIGDGASLELGELIAMRIHHSCTTFDKWTMVPVVDDGYNVVDAFRTFF